jgi:ComEC/Rec2-related protein
MSPPLKIKPPPIQWSPLATMGAVATLGSYVGSKLSPAPTSTLLFIFSATTLLVVGVFFIRSNIRQIVIAIAVLFLFTAKASHHPPAPPWATTIRNDLTELKCTIISDPIVSRRTKGPMSKFDHREATTWFYAQATPIKTTTQQLFTGVQIEGEHALNQGDTLRCIGWLRESPKDNGRFVFYSTHAPILTHQPGPQPRQSIQRSIQDSLTSELPPNQITLASALFLGIHDGGWQEISDTFKKAGMSHILAISGLHVALLLSISTVVFTKRGASPIWNTTIIFCAVFLLATIIEPRAPVIRSFIMATIIQLLRLMGQRCNTSSLLGFAALLFLSCNPKDASTTSFQLSFIVVASLCVLLPQIQWRILGPSDPNGKIRTLILRWFLLLWLTGVCAWSIAAPIVSHIFNTVSPSGLFSSAPSILLLMCTLLVGAIKACVTVAPDFLQPPITFMFSVTLNALLFTAVSFGNLPYAYFTNTTLSWLQSLMIVIWFIFWSLLIKKRAILWLSAPLIAYFVCVYKADTTTTITTLNVGHGTCHIIQDGKYTTIIDAGSRGNLGVGTKKIIPKLHTLGTKEIETIIITHADLDHLVGIVDVVKQFKTRKIIVAPQTLKHKTPLLEFVFKEARKTGTVIQSGSAGWSERLGTTTITIVSPKKNAPFHSSNASSIVLHIEAFSRSILFTGDIDEKRIQLLLRVLQNNTPMFDEIDVLEMPHHGEWSDESQKLLHSVQPKIALQSTSLARHSKDVWRIPLDTTRFVTAIDGDITTTITPDGTLRVSTSNAPATMSPCVFTN